VSSEKTELLKFPTRKDAEKEMLRIRAGGKPIPFRLRGRDYETTVEAFHYTMMLSWRKGMIAKLRARIDEVKKARKTALEGGEQFIPCLLEGKQYAFVEVLEVLGKPRLKCPSCGTLMVIVDVRDDGCRYFTCPKCGYDIAEETGEWFRKMEKETT